jgi:5'-3' exonuclease
VLTCYFGNDFLPAIPATSLSLDDSIHFVLTHYANTLAEEGNYMVQKATDTVFYWNHPFLIKFWNGCIKTEDSRMRMRTSQWLRRRHPSRRIEEK